MLIARFLCASAFLDAARAFGGSWRLAVSPATAVPQRTRTFPLEADAQAMGGGEEVQVTVRATSRAVVDVEALRGYGSQFFAPDQQPDDIVVMQAVSGVTAAGDDVIAAVSPGKIRNGGKVTVEARHIVPKPSKLPWAQAAALPGVAVSALCPMHRVGVSEATAKGKRCVVTGGHGSQAILAINALSAWGAEVISVSTASPDALKKAGASSVIDFRKDSFGDATKAAGGMQMVVDTVGREVEETRKMLREMAGAEYVSLMPQALKTAVDEGLLYGAGKLMAFSRAVGGDAARTYWMPGADAMAAVAAAAQLAESGRIGSGALGGGGFGGFSAFGGGPEYLEALAWPKDADTGLRYGFPGRTTRSWDWGGGGAAEDFDEEEEEDLAEFEAASAGDSVAAAVLEIAGEGDMALGEGQRCVLFISANSCRVCKYLQPHYRRLQGKYGAKVRFLHMNAKNDPGYARRLGLEAVPSFVSFREDGRVARVLSTSNKQKIEELITELAA